MARNIIFAPGEFYHLYNRGTEKRKVFTRPADYERFLALLYLCNGTEPVHMGNLLYQHKLYKGRTLIETAAELRQGAPLVDIAAYCLMPNHFHLLLSEASEDGISRYMQKLITAYSMYFNKRYERSGALFQGKFKAEHAGNDRYLKYLLSYIHLNPIKLIDSQWKEHGVRSVKHAQAHLEKYRYSSYPDYCGQRRAEQLILNKSKLPDYFGSAKSFKNGIEEWMSIRNAVSNEVEPR